MTTYADATASLPHSRKRHSFFNPATLLVLGLTAATSVGVWTAANQPQSAPTYTGDVGGFAFSPFHRGETPEKLQFPSEREIRSDLATVSRYTSQIRTYTLEGSLADIPRWPPTTR